MRRPRLAVLLLLSAAALQAGPGAVTALPATPQTSISDIEDEVMCPICGTLLELAQSPQARRERAFIAKLIARGRTKPEIEDALVRQYGRGVLALPKGSGFELSAYLIPAIAFALAVLGVGIGVRRWRSAAREPGGQPTAGGGRRGEGDRLRDEDAERLDADLERYDL